MLMSGLPHYKKFRSAIEGIGCKVNACDPCVANKMINGKQHTVSWHVDDLKTSHVDPKVNDEFLKWPQKNFGQTADVTLTSGKKHVHLGGTLDCSWPGQVKVNVTKCVNSMTEDSPLDLDGKPAAPANDNLFMFATLI